MGASTKGEKKHIRFKENISFMQYITYILNTATQTYPIRIRCVVVIHNPKNTIADNKLAQTYQITDSLLTAQDKYHKTTSDYHQIQKRNCNSTLL